MLTSVIFNSLIVVVALILTNFIFAILIAIKTKSFEIDKLPKFIATDLFPFIGGLMLLALLSVYLAELEYIYYGAVGIVSLKFGKEALYDKVKEFYSLWNLF